MEADEENWPFWKCILKFLFLAIFGLICTLMSWLQVAMWVGMFLWQLHKDQGAPNSIKEYRWKMKNIDMTRDQIIQELIKIDNVLPEDFDGYKENILSDMRGRGFSV
jgi:hypothetical protein